MRNFEIHLFWNLAYFGTSVIIVQQNQNHKKLEIIEITEKNVLQNVLQNLVSAVAKTTFLK